MTSGDIGAIKIWVDWSDQAVKHAATDMGVYVFRFKDGRTIPRLLRESDILLIGKAVKRSGIKSRLRDHLKRNFPLERIAREVASVEVGWKPCASEHEACLSESELIAHYERDHAELPPLNRTQPWRRVQEAKKHLKSLGKVGDEMLRVAREGGTPLELDEQKAVL
jgi:hypothetical protein